MVYTSYFGNLKTLKSAGIVPVSISLWKPKWYMGLQYLNLAPKADMLKRDLSKEQYTEEYKLRVLHNLNARNVYNDLMSFGSRVALLCYEKPNDFCHRHIVSEWFRENGYNVEEYRVEMLEPLLF